MNLTLPTWSQFVALFVKGGQVSNILASLEAHIDHLEYAATAQIEKATAHFDKADRHEADGHTAMEESQRAARVADKLKALVA